MSGGGLELLRLLQLASPALPIGAYHYSQGLESAIEAGIIRERATLEAWLRDQLELNLGRFEAPIFLRFFDAWGKNDDVMVAVWNRRFLAARETAELRVETVQMARSLSRLMVSLDLVDDRSAAWLASESQPTLPAIFSLAASRMGIARSGALHAYLWSWLENQATAALKAFSLGQSAAQLTLFALGPQVTQAVEAAALVQDDALVNACPGLALLCAQHETQYSRLFRS